MKRTLIGLLLGLSLTTQVYGQTDKEILFRGIPWGTNYDDVKSQLTEFKLSAMHNEGMDQAPISDVISGDKSYILKEFKNTHINIIAYSSGDIEVAGYAVSKARLNFAFTISDDTLPQDTEHSAFYGARYELEPLDLASASADLKEKLSSLYGDPDDVKTSTDIWDTVQTSTYWNGANNTQVVLTTFDNSKASASFLKDEIYISYVNTEGDKWLHEADDFLSAQKLADENALSGNGDTSGL